MKKLSSIKNIYVFLASICIVGGVIIDMANIGTKCFV